LAARQWTEEQRARQATIIRLWQPWTKSTGARTPEGKAKASKNVLVGKRKKQIALDQAVQELKAAQEKVIKLGGKNLMSCGMPGIASAILLQPIQHFGNF
jgi:hypothetical protein